MAGVRNAGIGAANQIQKRFTNLGHSMKRLGSTLTRSLTLPLAALGGLSVKAFADFDSAMTQSTAIMDGITNDVRAEMEAAARSVSEQLTVTSKQAAESYFFLASAGLDAQQSIAALPQVAKFAQAGMFDMAKATDLATDAQSALGLTVEDASQNLKNMTRVTDVLVKANTLANASVQQFSEALTNRAAASMRAANKEVEEGVAVLAAFADQGMKGQMAGEQFARILRILSQEAAKSRELFTDLGLIDASGNLANMADIIDILTKEMKGLSDAEKSAKLETLGFTARVQAAIKPLLGTADAIREYEEGLRRASGITQEVSDKQLKSLSAQFSILKNTVVNAAQAIGASIAETFDLKGVVKNLQENIKTAIKWFNNLSQETRKMAFTIAGILGASGPVIAVLGALSLAIGAISAPMVGVVAAIGAGAAAIITHWEDVEAYFTTGGGAQMWRDLKGIVDNTIRLVKSLWKTFGDDIIEITKVAWGTISDLFETTLSAINATIKVWADVFNGEIDSALNTAENSFRETFGNIRGIVDSILAFGTRNDPFSRWVFESLGLLTSASERAEKDFLSSLDASAQGLIDARHELRANAIRPEDIIIPADDIDFSMGKLDVGAKMWSNFIPQAVIDRSVQLGESIKQGLAGNMNKFKKATGGALLTGTEGMSLLQIATQKTAEQIAEARRAGAQMGQVIGDALSQAVLHGRKLVDVVSNLIKQLASRVFVQGLMMLLSGGTVGGGGLAGAIFGGLFHDGGIVPGGQKDRMVRVRPGEGIFTPGQMRAMGQGGGQSISRGDMRQAFSDALSAHLQRLGPEDIYALSKRGGFSY